MSRSPTHFAEGANNIMRARASFWAMLGQETFVGPDEVYQRIRQAMLSALAHFCSQEPLLEMDITNARDLSELWYLRPRLLAAIAAAHHSSIAEEELRMITNLFSGHFANAISSKFGAL
jgi:hypothetical protein